MFVKYVAQTMTLKNIKKNYRYSCYHISLTRFKIY